MKFTQQQLEDAYEQMKAERKAEWQVTDDVASFLNSSGVALHTKYVVHSKDSILSFGRDSSDVTPFPKSYILSFNYGEYDPHIADEFSRLKKLGWAVTEAPPLSDPTGKMYKGQKTWEGQPGLSVYGFKFTIDLDAIPEAQAQGHSGQYFVYGSNYG